MNEINELEYNRPSFIRGFKKLTKPTISSKSKFRKFKFEDLKNRKFILSFNMSEISKFKNGEMWFWD